MRDTADTPPGVGDDPARRLPVVLTSINPFARLDHQLRCLRAWQALGFEALSFNHPEEILRLAEAGVPEAALVPATEEDTGLALFGKPVPRVAAMLARVAQLRPARPVILVNSDIYPAACGPGFTGVWFDCAPALALTREEVACLECSTETGRTPYRGGLDAFALEVPALARINAELAARPVAARMCFGIPGWDYLMGALIVSPRIGGTILDSGLLLHETHRTTYADVEEFAHYLEDIAALVDLRHTNATEGAAAFAALISARCDAATGHTALVRAMHFERVVPSRPPTPEAVAAARWLMGLSPELRWNHNLLILATLADRIRHDPAFDLFSTLAFFADCRPGNALQMTDLLAATLLHLRVRPGAAPSDSYPPGNLHARAIEVILNATADDPPRRHLELARLFCEELVSYAIFNPRLYNYLALGCGNDDERRLLHGIAVLVGVRVPDDRAAAAPPPAPDIPAPPIRAPEDCHAA